MSAKPCLSLAALLGCALLMSACASELPAGAPPMDPYGPPTAMNAPNSKPTRSKDAEQPETGGVPRDAAASPSSEDNGEE